MLYDDSVYPPRPLSTTDTPGVSVDPRTEAHRDAPQATQRHHAHRVAAPPVGKRRQVPIVVPAVVETQNIVPAAIGTPRRSGEVVAM